MNVSCETFILDDFGCVFDEEGCMGRNGVFRAAKGTLAAWLGGWVSDGRPTTEGIFSPFWEPLAVEMCKLP